MPFEPGQSGNPGGRPKGSVSPRTEIRKYFKENAGDLAEIIKAQVEKAKGGDTTAYKALVEWIECPMPKQIDLNSLSPEQAAAILAELDSEPLDDSEVEGDSGPQA